MAPIRRFKGTLAQPLQNPGNPAKRLLPSEGTLLKPRLYSRSQKVGNPITSNLKSNVSGIPALFGLNPVSNLMGLTVKQNRGFPRIGDPNMVP